MNWIDAHCHLSDPRVSVELVLNECRKSGITRFVLGGVGPEDWARQEALASAHPGVFLKVFGIHPWRVDELAQKGLEKQLEQELVALEEKLSGAVALGETGLDAGRDRFKRSKAAQVRFFEAQIVLAERQEKPLVLHIVRAHSVALEVLRRRTARTTSGLIHSFSGTWADAQAYLELGFALSISARVTFPEAKDLHETVFKAPPEALVFETDAPDQPPFGAAGKVHTPLSLLRVVEKASEIRSESATLLLDRSRDNLSRIFRF